MIIEDHPTDCEPICVTNGQLVGVELQMTFVGMCVGCRQVKDSNRRMGIQLQNDQIISSRRATKGENAEFLDTTTHFCEPLSKSSIIGVEARRCVQKQLAAGLQENIAVAKVRLRTEVTRQFGNRDDFCEIEEAAMGRADSNSMHQSLYRSQIKRFPVVKTLNDFINDAPGALLRTLRGNIKEN